MPAVQIYLNFKGNCEEAFNFYKSVFGGEFGYIGRFSDMPAEEGQPEMPAEMGNMVMHVSLPIGKGTTLMGSDTGGEWAPTFVPGNNFAISLEADSKQEADKLYAALSEGGQQTMPMNLTFWGSYFGMFTDKFGINWMISFDENPNK